MKFKTFKAFLESKNITTEQFDDMDAEKQRELFEEHTTEQAKWIEDLEKKVGDSITKEELDAIKADLTETNKRSSEALAKAVSDQGIAIKNMLRRIQGGSMSNSEKAQINQFIEENAAAIKNAFNTGGAPLEFTTKAVADITTGSASNPDGIPEIAGVQMAPPSNVNLRGAIVDSLVTTLSTSLSSYPYTETEPKEGNSAWVAEGGTKPQIDLRIKTRYAEPKKVAAHMILTEESITDIPGLQSIATDFLRKKHDLKRQNGILFGTGAADDPIGATAYGRTFVAGAMANAVTNPNFMDVVNACVTDIYVTHNFQDEVPYMANLVMANPIDFFTNLVAAKDDNGLPLYPMASLFNRVTIGGVTIVPFEDMPSGKIFVCDMSKYNITNYVPYTIRIGWINDQFITNKFTMVGESRLHAFVKFFDEQAFIYDDIAVVKAAITAV